MVVEMGAGGSGDGLDATRGGMTGSMITSCLVTEGT